MGHPADTLHNPHRIVPRLNHKPEDPMLILRVTALNGNAMKKQRVARNNWDSRREPPGLGVVRVKLGSLGRMWRNFELKEDFVWSGKPRDETMRQDLQLRLVRLNCKPFLNNYGVD